MAALVVDLGSCMLCCLAGSARWCAATAFWVRIALPSPSYGASDGAVPGAPASVTVGVLRHGRHVEAAWTCGFFRTMSTETWP